MATNNSINVGRNTFSAYLSSTVSNVTGDATNYTVICDTELVDEGSCYNNTTGIYTVPVTGNYHFDFTCAFDNLQSNHTTGQIFINKNSDQYQLYYLNPYVCSSGNYISVTGGITIPCNLSDQISFHLVVVGGSKIITVYKGAGYWTFYSGYQLL